MCCLGWLADLQQMRRLGLSRNANDHRCIVSYLVRYDQSGNCCQFLVRASEAMSSHSHTPLLQEAPGCQVQARACLSAGAAEPSSAAEEAGAAEEPCDLCCTRTGLAAVLAGALFCGSLPMPALALPPSRAALRACVAVSFFVGHGLVCKGPQLLPVYLTLHALMTPHEFTAGSLILMQVSMHSH